MPVIHRGRGGPVQNPPPSSRVEPEDVYQDVETGNWWLRLANRWTELPPDYLPSKAVTSNPGHGPLPIPPTPPFTGQVTDAGGGNVTLRLDRDTVAYPAVGDVVDCRVRTGDQCDSVLVSSVRVSTKTGLTRRTQVRCQERGDHPLHRARLEDGPDGSIQTLEWR